jgi:hypothetical protein
LAHKTATKIIVHFADETGKQHVRFFGRLPRPRFLNRYWCPLKRNRNSTKILPDHLTQSGGTAMEAEDHPGSHHADSGVPVIDVPALDSVAQVWSK